MVGAVKRAAARRSVAEARFLLILKTEMFAAGSKIGTSFDANAERQGFNHSQMLICGGLITKLLAGPQGCAVVFPLVWSFRALPAGLADVRTLGILSGRKSLQVLRRLRTGEMSCLKSRRI